MKYLQKTITLVLTAILTLLLCLPVFATDPAGDAGGDVNVPVPAEDGRSWLTNSMYYDTAARLFCYPVENSRSEIRANVADGMIVTNPVSIQGVSVMLYQDGRLWNGDAANVTEPGEYVVMAEVAGKSTRIFTFPLVGSATSTVYAYHLPAGMYVNEAERDGEPIPYERASVPMQEDGLYHVVYECISTGVIYELSINVDRTPPELEFSGEIDENHRVHSALRFSGVQEGDIIKATLDGVSIDVYVNADGTGELPDSGRYIITVYDAAGNSTEYGYTVLLYLNASSLSFFLLLAACVLAIIVYVIIKRKRLEIG